MGKPEFGIDVDPELLRKAQAAGVDVVAATEAALREALARSASDREARGRQWAADNADALRAYGDRIEQEGCFGEAWRDW